MTEPADTYANGMRFVIAVLFFAMTAVAVLEIYFERRGWASVSYRFEDRSLQVPWLSAALLVVFFMLLAHFVLNPLCPQDQPLCP